MSITSSNGHVQNKVIIGLYSQFRRIREQIPDFRYQKINKLRNAYFLSPNDLNLHERSQAFHFPKLRHKHLRLTILLEWLMLNIMPIEFEPGWSTSYLSLASIKKLRSISGFL